MQTKVKLNPCVGIERNPKNVRQHYVEDVDYNKVRSLASPTYLPILIELAYLCRLRKNEVLSLTYESIKENGLYVIRGKGSKHSLILWTDRLRKAVESAKSLPCEVRPLDPRKMALLHDNDGQAITIGAVDSAWKRLMKKAKKEEFTPFWIHDLKRKGVSDFEGDKLKASGHRDPNMLRVYDVKPDEIEGTR